MSLDEVFAKYEHLDEALSDGDLCGSFTQQIAHELWIAIKEARVGSIRDGETAGL